jgi:hypothetical protein
MYTEEEAKKKWCQETFNTNVPGKCVASDCGAWRWDNNNNLLLCGYAGKATPEGFTKREDGNFERIKPIGYCGKAGTP